METQNNTKQVSRKELLQLAFFKLVKQGKEKAALSLSSKLISSDQSGSHDIRFGDKEEELEAIRTIKGFLEGKPFDELCSLTRAGHYMFDITGKDVTINNDKYGKNQ